MNRFTTNNATNQTGVMSTGRIENLDTSEDVVIKFRVNVDEDNKGIELYSVSATKNNL